MRKITHIITHHSGTRDDNFADNTNAIRLWHINHNHWQDIGYHFLIEKIADHYEIIVGRPLHIIGAHAKGYNENSIGICFVGDYENYVVDPMMITIAVKRIYIPLIKLFNIPLENIIAHRDVNNTECPGRLFPMTFLKEKINELLK